MATYPVTISINATECCASFGHVGTVSSQHSSDTAKGPEKQSRGKEGSEEATGNPKNKVSRALIRKRA